MVEERVPRRAIDELRETGFRRLACLGDDDPAPATTDW